VFTNGCFDILHIGHVRYLQSAKAEGDILVIGLNSDRSVHIIKGEKRPVIGEQQRAEVLASVGFVDYIILFDEPDPHALIAAIAPDALVKGADWAEDHIVGADVVKAAGGRVVRVPVVPDVSTSRIIADIVRKYR
jgi:rfaE bifunctional protein nucleotidyltransferase chain/domain